MKRFQLALLLAVAWLAVLPLRGGSGGVRAEIRAGKLKARVGEAITFSAGDSRTDPGRTLSLFSWDFDDRDLVAENAAGPEAVHVFNRTGAYTVKLTVRDDLGRKDEAFLGIEVMPDADDGPSITADLEGGKTGVLFSSPETFAFQLEWGNQFYFRLDNCRDRETSIRIIGYGPNRKQLPSVTPYEDDDTFDGRFTLMYSRDYQVPDWQPFQAAEYLYDAADSSLTARFVPEEDSLYFAWSPPWTMRNLRTLIDRWEENDSFAWRVIGESVEGRPVIALTVTDFREPSQRKKAIWITGTQHAYEMAAGPVVEGILARLLDGSDSSSALLKNYVYNIVPLMNPDSSVKGGYRYNQHDIDLNRNWDDLKQDDWDSVKSEPEVACVKDAIAGWVEDNGTLDLFLDFHCLTAIAENLLMIKAAPQGIPDEISRAQTRFVSGFLRRRWVFRESESVNPNSANAFISREYARRTGVLSFTAEHCLGFISTAGGKMRRASPESFRRLGGDYVELIDAFFTERE